MEHSLESEKSWDIFAYLTCYFFDICCLLCA